MKKILISIFALLLIFSCSGCWNKVELNNYAIVTGISVDYEDGEYLVSFLITNSAKSESESNSKNIDAVIYKGKGKSIYSAIKEISLISPKELYIEHLSILILSEDIAKRGLYNALDFFVREPTAKNEFYVVLSKDKAIDVLEILSPLSDFESQNIADNLESSEKLQGSISLVYFNDLISDLLKEGKNPSINGIKIIGNPNKGSNKKSLETSNIKNYIKIGTLGIFKGDKLITWTTKEESIGINIINNKINETIETFNCKDGYIVIGTEEFSTKISVSLENNKPKAKIISKGNAVIHETNCNIDLNDKSTMNKLEKGFENELKKSVKKSIMIAQKYKTDVFGFGNLFYKNYYNYYKNIKSNWDENVFPKMQFEIEMNINLESKGSAENTLERIKNET